MQGGGTLALGGSAYFDPNRGAVLAGNAAIGVGASAQGSGSFNALGGLVAGNAAAQVDVGARATVDGSASFNGRRAEATVNAAAGVGVKASGHAEIEAGVGPVKAFGRAQGEAYAGAAASAGGRVVLDPLKGDAYAEGRAGAFAGAKAEGRLTAGLKKIGSISLMGAVGAGAGVEAGARLGFKGGKFIFGLSKGAFAKVGGALGFHAEVDVKGMAETAHGAAKSCAKSVHGCVSDGARDTAKAAVDASGAGLHVLKGVNSAALKLSHLSEKIVPKEFRQHVSKFMQPARQVMQTLHGHYDTLLKKQSQWASKTKAWISDTADKVKASTDRSLRSILGDKAVDDAAALRQKILGHADRIGGVLGKNFKDAGVAAMKGFKDFSQATGLDRVQAGVKKAFSNATKGAGNFLINIFGGGGKKNKNKKSNTAPSNKNGSFLYGRQQQQQR